VLTTARRSTLPRPLLAGLLAAGLLAGGLSATAGAAAASGDGVAAAASGDGVAAAASGDGVAAAASGDVVLSEVYGGGGNSGATYRNDFVELENRGSAAVDVSGWSVQYASAAGSTWQVSALTGSIAPGAHYLVGEAAGAGGTTDLPAPEVSGTIAMSATAGKVALVTSATALPGCGADCATQAGVRDFVGYGTTASAFEGTGRAPAPSNTTSDTRTAGPDTDDNAADFTTATPRPENGGGQAPSITAQPAATTVEPGASATLTVTASGAAPLHFQWYQGTSGDTSTPVGSDAASFTTGALSSTTSYWVRVTNGAGSTDSATATVTVAEPCTTTPVTIGSVQGTGDVSPVAGTSVTVRGTVVGDDEGPAPALRGFYLQDAGDGDPATSDGIFVFRGDSDDVRVGDDVEVTGTAAEFQGQTQLSTTSVEVCGHDTTRPAVDVTLPVASATALERYEGMLVRFHQKLFVTEHFQLGRFGQVVVSSGDRLAQPTNLYPADDPRSGALAAANALNRLIVDDASQGQNPDPIVFGRDGQPLSAENTLRGGDTVTDAVGVLTYTWGGNAASPNAYRLRPVGALGGSARFTAENPRPAGPPSVGAATVKVASANLLNFFNTFGTTACSFGVGGAVAECRGASDDVEYRRQLAKEVSALTSLDADVIGIMEMENDGYGPDSAIAALVAALNERQGAGTWAFVDVDAATGRVNAAGTDAIKAGVLYRPASVTPVPGTTRVHPDAAQFERLPIAQTFETRDGGRFSVVVNHFKSKGSCPTTAGPDSDQGDGQSCWNARRTAQAQALASWIASTVVPGAGDPDVLAIGDLNSYAKEDPILALQAAGLTNLVEAYSGAKAYSYAFDGQWGYLDQALATSSLRSQVTGAADVHINADEPSVLDYLTDFKSAGQIDSLYSPDRFRTSDHDPVVVGLRPTGVQEFGIRPLAPINGSTWLGGLPLPVLFQVTGPDGKPLDRTRAAALVAPGACRLSVTLSGVQSAPGVCPAYDRLTNTFSTLVPTRRGPRGLVSVKVSLSYPSSLLVTQRSTSVRLI
jgi:predicted extracellular nuclease